MVKIQNLNAGYHGKRVLYDINTMFQAETVTMIIGPNGSGKSTLLRTALGLHPKTGGQIFFDGTESSTMTRVEIAKQIAFLGQEHSIPNIMVEKMVLHGRYPYLGFPRQYSSRDMNLCYKALQEMRAENLAKRNMVELSGGQRQKIHLAMALAQNTPNLWLDEPTTYLDLRHQIEVMNVVRKLAIKKKSVVMIIHDLCMALQTADRLLVMNEGKKVLEGTTDEVFQSGVLKEVFGVVIDRLSTQNGWRYYLET